MKTMLVVFGLLLVRCALAATLFTAPIDAPSGYQSGCEAVNVSGSPVTISVYIIDGDNNAVVASYLNCTSSSTSPGCAITHITGIGDSGFFYCKFVTDSASKTTIRANGKVSNPGTGDTGDATDAQ